MDGAMDVATHSHESVFAHVDMDAFYASVEIRDDPSLRGKPVAVGGGANQRGVVSAASYEARKFGVHSAMSMAEALRLCPQLIRLPGDMAKYQDVSRQIFEVFRSFSPSVEGLSLDEAFLDLSGTRSALGEPVDVGRRIKTAIRDRVALTASVGIAPVKFVAKIASDLEKPDGLVVVAPDRLHRFLRPLPIYRLWGVGERTRETLAELGIATIGDLAAIDIRILRQRLGQHGDHLHDLANGIDERRVTPDVDAKSYSHEQTFARDVGDLEVIEAVLLDQSVRVARRLRKDSVVGRVVHIKLRYPDFRTFTRQLRLPGPTAVESRIYEVARGLFHANWERRPVRLVGVGVSGVVGEDTENLDLFSAERDERARKLADTLDRIEDRFGRDKVIRAKTLRRSAAKGTGSYSDRPLPQEPE